jgi:predicted dehydrogenase
LADQTLKIGVVGIGHIADHRHIPIIQKIRDAKVTAVCDIQESLVKGAAEKFGIEHWYTSISEMLKGDVQVVDITTPPQTHYKLALECMEAGKHVIVEKPLAMTVEEVEEMYRVADREGVRLCSLHQNIYNPVVMEAVKMYKDGDVGELITVGSGTYVRPNNYMVTNENHWCHKLPGGIFFETIPHPVYVLQEFLKNAKPVYALTRKLTDKPWLKAEEALIMLEADNGMGLVTVSHNSPYHGDDINIFGTKLGLQVDLWGRSIIKHKEKTEEPMSVGLSNLDLASQSLGIIGSTVGSALKMATGGVEISAHYGFLNAYVDSILNDKPLPVSKDKALDNVRIVNESCKLIEDTW